MNAAPATNALPAPVRTLLLISVVVMAWSAWRPHDRATWWMETIPVFVVLPLLWLTRRGFRLTPLLYALIALHAVVLAVGGHYTYALVPLGEWAKHTFDLSRNHYDRLGHLMQGLVPAIAARELLLRRTGLRAGGWLFAVVTLSCLGISALYELIEWGAAVSLGQGADQFLATQGDVWDTQKDMLMAGIGALLGQLLLARVHDAQLGRLTLPRRA